MSDRFRGCPTARVVFEDGTELDAYLAAGLRRRMLGLAWLAEPPELGLLIPRCNSVHTVGMRFAIDIAFITWPPPEGGASRVLELRRAVKPMRLATMRLRGHSVRRAEVATLELPAGGAASLGLVHDGELGDAALP